MTPAEHMRRLWQDPAFRERARERLRAHMTALNKSPAGRKRARKRLAKQRQDPVFVEKQRAGARKWMTTYRRGFEDHPDADGVGMKVWIRMGQRR